MKKDLRVGVIGVGKMGRHHARIYSTLKNVDFVGISDPNKAQAETICQSYGCKYFEKLEDLLKEVDAVTIAAPTSLHYEIGKKCFENNVNVLMEKPVAATVNDAKELKELADKKKLVLMVGHVERFNSTVQVLTDLLKVEKPCAFEVKRAGPYDPRISDVDVIRDLMIHDIDIVLKLADSNVKSINASGLIKKENGHLNHVIAQIGFESGVLATLTASNITERRIREMNVNAEGSYIEIDYLDRKILVHRKTAIEEFFADKYKFLEIKQDSLIQEIHVPDVEPLLAELRHFTDCVQNGKTPFITAEDGIRALEVAEEIYEKVEK